MLLEDTAQLCESLAMQMKQGKLSPEKMMTRRTGSYGIQHLDLFYKENINGYEYIYFSDVIGIITAPAQALKEGMIGWC